MRELAIAIGYATPFFLFILTPPGLDSIFLAAYFSAILGSMALPLAKHDPSSVRNSSLYKGLLGGTVGLFIISLYLEFLFGLLKMNVTKVNATGWILFSMIFPIGSALSVSRLGTSLVKNGLDGLRRQDDSPTGFQHFALEYCTVRWFRHGNYFLLCLVGLAMYLYGWSLLGLPFLLYSISLLIFSLLLLGTLSRRFLAPFLPDEVVARIESINPSRTFKTNFRRPSPPGLVIIFSILTLAGYVRFVPNPLTGVNLAVFSMLIIMYAASLWFYGWTAKSQDTSRC